MVGCGPVRAVLEQAEAGPQCLRAGERGQGRECDTAPLTTAAAAHPPPSLPLPQPPKPSRLALFFTGRKGSGEAAAAEDALTTAPPQARAARLLLPWPPSAASLPRSTRGASCPPLYPQVELPNAFMLVFDILSEGSAAPPSAAPSACTSEVPETAVCAATCAITECAAKLAAARGAKAHRTACMALADFGAGIVEALDAKGEAGRGGGTGAGAGRVGAAAGASVRLPSRGRSALAPQPACPTAQGPAPWPPPTPPT